MKYGGASAEALVTEYDDPAGSFAKLSHGHIGTVFQALLEDLGIGDSGPSVVELIEMLLGDDTKLHLDAKVEGYGPLREVIEKKLEDCFSEWYVYFQFIFSF